MYKRTFRITRAALLLLAAPLFGATGAVGCADAGPEQAVEDSAVKNVLISAGTIARLGAGEQVRVDLGDAARYFFDFRTAIDFGRVTVVSPDGTQIAMSEALAQWNADGFDPLVSSDQRFVMAGDPSYFTELTPGDIAELLETGTLVKSNAPSLQPQTEGVCEPQVVYHVEIIYINGVPYTVTCVIVIPCEEECVPTGAETCNGLDDDCDGTVDEDTSVTCSNECGTMERACVDGQLEECALPQPIPAGNQIQLTGTIRDFNDSHPDFQSYLGTDPGIVLADLGADDKPVYAGQAGNPSTHGQGAFDQWYRDVPGVNLSAPYTITLTKQANSSVYTYQNSDFFPIDGQLFGNQGRSHNYHFTYELNTPFLYSGGEVFTFTGDDDVFVFINGKRAMDLGGVHTPLTATVNLDQQAAALGITTGNVYNMRVFFAERHTVLSSFRIDTTIDQFYTCQ